MFKPQDLLRRAQPRLTRRIALQWGDTFPFYYVSEYPKSGGTWLAQMVSDYTQVALPQQSLLPVAMKAIIHNHWDYDDRYTRPAYITRDGRDVMVSYYFHRMRLIQNRLQTGEALLRRYEKVFGPGFDPADSVRWLPRFIDDEFSRNLTWPRHVDDWYGKSHVVYVTYEELLANAATGLRKVVEHITEQPADDERLENTAQKFSFARQTGRKRGREDRASFLRKGVAGDWTNHFTRETAERFDALAGATLVRLGYEKDRGWVDRYELPG